MRFVDNGKAEDFALLCFKGMDVPISKCGLQYDIRKGDFIQQREEKSCVVETDQDYGLMPLNELELDTRAMNCLRRAKIETVGQLLEMTVEEVMALRSMGIGTVNNIINALAKLGLALKEKEV